MTSVYAILKELHADLKRLPKSKKLQGVGEHLQHCIHKDITATIRLYIEDDMLWFQFRVHVANNEIHNVNFKRFIEQRKAHILPSGKRVTLTDFFVNSPNDENHRFGADVIIDKQPGNFTFDDASDVMDYLLTYPYLDGSCHDSTGPDTPSKGVKMFIVSCCRSTSDMKDIIRVSELYEKYRTSVYFDDESIVAFINVVKEMGFLTTNHTKHGEYKNKKVFRGLSYYN